MPYPSANTALTPSLPTCPSSFPLPPTSSSSSSFSSSFYNQSRESCCLVCLEAEECAAWTWERDSHQCWLKAVASKATPSTCCDSGSVGDFASTEPGVADDNDHEKDTPALGHSDGDEDLPRAAGYGVVGDVPTAGSDDAHDGGNVAEPSIKTNEAIHHVDDDLDDADDRDDSETAFVSSDEGRFSDRHAEHEHARQGADMVDGEGPQGDTPSADTVDSRGPRGPDGGAGGADGGVGGGVDADALGDSLQDAYAAREETAGHIGIGATGENGVSPVVIGGLCMAVVAAVMFVFLGYPSSTASDQSNSRGDSPSEGPTGGGGRGSDDGDADGSSSTSSVVRARRRTKASGTQ